MTTIAEVRFTLAEAKLVGDLLFDEKSRLDDLVVVKKSVKTVW